MLSPHDSLIFFHIEFSSASGKYGSENVFCVSFPSVRWKFAPLNREGGWSLHARSEGFSNWNFHYGYASERVEYMSFSSPIALILFVNHQEVQRFRLSNRGKGVSWLNPNWRAKWIGAYNSKLPSSSDRLKSLQPIACVNTSEAHKVWNMVQWKPFSRGFGNFLLRIKLTESKADLSKL